MINQPMLPEFEGMTVSKCSVRITKAGDGLSEALDLEPKAMHAGDEAFYVIKVQFTSVNHKADKKSGTLVRVHTAEVEDIVEIDAATAVQMIDEERAELRRRQREAAVAHGRPELPLDGELESGPVDGELEVVDDSATGPVDPWEYDTPGGAPVDVDDDQDEDEVSPIPEPEAVPEPAPPGASEPPAPEAPKQAPRKRAPAKKAAKKAATRGEL